MAGTEETNDNNILPVTDDTGDMKQVCSELPESTINGSTNITKENSDINHRSDNDIQDNPSENDENVYSGDLKIDEAVSDYENDGPVDYSQKGLKTASKSEKDFFKNIPDKSMTLFGPYISGIKVPFSGGILYQGVESSQFVSPLLHKTSLPADVKPMRPFKAYNAARDLLSGLPSLAGYAIPVGGKICGSPIPIRINNTNNTSVSQGPTNGTSVSSVSTHLMTLATEADKLRQQNCDGGKEKDKTENSVSEDGMTSDGNDSYKEDINEFYPQGLPETQKKKGKKRKCSLADQMKDETYWERRRKNNEAAKRSRDARRAKEDQIAIRAALLEQENMRLRIELAALKEEMIKLRGSVYGKNDVSGKPS
ncbi:uncharacterized protein LOC117108471 isoform X2 [Anneissia japonica]|nr:uncharacterized protein LOC117108471 isoform X2 [Anneissia japonica]